MNRPSLRVLRFRNLALVLCLGALLWLVLEYGNSTSGVNAQSPGVRGPLVGVPVVAAAFDGDVQRLTPTVLADKQIAPPARRVSRKNSSPPSNQATDPIMQSHLPGDQMPAPLLSFKGISYTFYSPPDANGDVGPNHYIQAVNISIAIFSKSGSNLATFTLNSLWSAANTGTPCDTAHRGDPIVLYDAVSDRWIIGDMAWVSQSDGPYYECIAVSKTNDPIAGGWWLYGFRTDDDLHPYLSDYPKLAVWNDGIYMTANLFDIGGLGESAQGARVWALHREDLISGNALQSVSFLLPCGYPCFANLLPSNLRGPLPPIGRPNFVTAVAEPNLIYLWKFHVDWNTLSNSTFTGPTILTVANFVMPCSAALILACVPQNGGEAVDSLGDRLMMQLQYRNRGGIESLWMNHTIAANSSVGTPTGIRWYEVRDPNGTPAIFQQGTFQPDANYRWMGSLAVDQKGNMALGYSVSSTTMFPAIRYAGRLVSDSPGQLTKGERVLIQSTGAQAGGGNRWGDYTAMTVDPVDDCTFWYTNEYFETTGQNWATRIGAFQFTGCANPLPTPVPTLTPTVQPCSNVPTKPGLVSPPKGAEVHMRKVPLDWTDVACATRYVVVVKRESRTGQVIDRSIIELQSQDTTVRLKWGNQYFWRVKACNEFGCGDWSAYGKFLLSPNVQ